MSKQLMEVALTGGNTNIVVKLGETVRRTMGSQSETVHAFLRHLEDKNIQAPRFLGIDEKGREILSFIEGGTDFPDDLWTSTDVMIESVQLLRRFHDASVEFVAPVLAQWKFEYPDPARHDVICHNDFAPYNMVFMQDGSISIIDFDLCGPGPRVRDLAYLAYWMVPLSFDSKDMKPFAEKDLGDNSARLKRLLAEYGIEQHTEFVAMVSEVLHHMSDADKARKMVGEAAAIHLQSHGHFEHWAREASAFDERCDTLLANLADTNEMI